MGIIWQIPSVLSSLWEWLRASFGGEMFAVPRLITSDIERESQD